MLNEDLVNIHKRRPVIISIPVSIFSKFQNKTAKTRKTCF